MVCREAVNFLNGILSRKEHELTASGVQDAVCRKTNHGFYKTSQNYERITVGLCSIAILRQGAAIVKFGSDECIRHSTGTPLGWVRADGCPGLGSRSPVGNGGALTVIKFTFFLHLLFLDRILPSDDGLSHPGERVAVTEDNSAVLAVENLDLGALAGTRDPHMYYIPKRRFVSSVCEARWMPGMPR